MKKIMILLIVGLLVLPCVCFAEEETDISIDFESPILVYEDDNIRIELQSFFQKFMNWGAGREPAFEKGLVFKYYNKTDYEIWFELEQAYLGMDAVMQTIHAGDGRVAPGKASVRAYLINHYDGIKYKPLKSIDDLYLLDGTVRVLHIYGGNQSNKIVKVPFSLPDLMNEVIGAEN